MNKSPQQPFSLLETMRWEHRIALLDRHLSRSESAAATLGFPFNEAKIREQLQQYVASLDGNAIHRLRLTVDSNGDIDITSRPLDENVKPFQRVVVHAEPINSEADLRHFKTTKRDAYEAAYDAAQSLGCDEALLLNERGEVAEGSRTNVWIRRGSQWLTPLPDSGCLPGVYRAHLLDTVDDASEAILTVDDLVSADEIAVSNAVHGLCTVELILNA